ncbi:MAG TPA: ferrous iron transport protein B [Saprospiraceae bacterium]|nr:ferrous iron transport protein B [Saprospiraceae bacterium]HNT19956.1 ferrous iron transport protein B [Saprospiraceae bacterium]
MKKIAILGNPNSGKSSVFNRLTGLAAKVGNFPGVTVEKKKGTVRLPSGQWVDVIDFPGVYSLHPNSKDEFIVTNILTHPDDADFPDLVLYVADIMHLEKQLLLFTQLIDLGLPVIMVLTMKDLADKDRFSIDLNVLKATWDIPIFAINARNQESMPAILQEMDRQLAKPSPLSQQQYKLSYQEQALVNELNDVVRTNNAYQSLLVAHYHQQLNYLKPGQSEQIGQINTRHGFNSIASQIRETMQRYDFFTSVVRKSASAGTFKVSRFSEKADDVLTHRWWGILIFVIVNFFIFQAMFTWASYPMDWIETVFGWAGAQVKNVVSSPGWSSFISDGILAGLGGIIVFIPQIAILFFLITVLEDLGYMARAVYLFDRLLLKFGLNGKSLVSLLAGGACAIPAIMSARTISNQKERLITTLVTPFISCSARIPVYTILVGFVVSSSHRTGPFNTQGVLFMGLYLLGIITALLAGWILKQIIKSEDRSFLMIELPDYKVPDFKVAFQTALSKAWSFVVEAGKIILIISMVLWVLSSYGPQSKMKASEQEVGQIRIEKNLTEEETASLLANKKLEASYAGTIGKWMEPMIRPLGFDWKIGIALFTSFAAREVFVATMSTLYSLGSTEDYSTITERLAAEKDPETLQPRFTMPVAISLLLFYVFAMQCMSTMAVVRRETGGWKWPLIQFFFMCGLAYLASLVAYQVLS